MVRSPATRPSLLARLHDHGDPVAWSEFVEIYGPLVYSYGRHRGLQDADASDLVQDVLRSVAAASGRFVYDPERGSFRGWLLAITRNALRRSARRAADRVSPEGGSTHALRMAELPDDDAGDEQRWEREHRERLFAWAAERVRTRVQPTTWEAFWKTAVEHQPAEAVAQALGISAGAVYIARSRVLARMREAIDALEGGSSPSLPEAPAPGRPG